MGNVRFWGNKVLFTENDKVAMHKNCCCLPPWYKFTWNDQVCYQSATYGDAYTLIKKWDNGGPVDFDKEVWVEPGTEKSTLPGKSGMVLVHYIQILKPVDLYYKMWHWSGALNTHYYKVTHNGSVIDSCEAHSKSSDYMEGHFVCAVGDEVLFYLDPSYDITNHIISDNIVNNEEYWQCQICEPCEEGTPGAELICPDPMFPEWCYWAICDDYTMAPKYLTHG